MSINDPRWGRRPDESGNGQDENRPEENECREKSRDEENCDEGRRREASGRQANDLDQLWNNFNSMLGGILGGGKSDRKCNQNRHGADAFERDENDSRENRQDFERRDKARYRSREDDGNVPPREPPYARKKAPFGKDPKTASVKGFLVLVAVALVVWIASGIYIVPEGQVGVVTTFGRYTQDSAAGINWRMPWPVQDVELVDVSSVRKAEIGIRGSASRLKEALMLTDDENIVDVMFNVQYRIKPHSAKDFLFRSREPDKAVFDAAESAMREVVGRKAMDSVLFESKQEIAEAVRNAMQTMLDRYQTGIEVMSVAIQNAQPPEQVQAAFNDAVKAGQDRERQINEGEAYANAVVPAAKGLASRLVQEAEGYKARVVETAKGDAERFTRVLEQYEKAPQVTRERIYIDTMRDIYSNTKKVLVDSRAGNNLLYLPFDKLMDESAKAAEIQPAAAAPVTGQTATGGNAASVHAADDARILVRSRGR